MSHPTDQSLVELTVQLRDLYLELDQTIDAMEVGSAESIELIGQKMKVIKQTETQLDLCE